MLKEPLRHAILIAHRYQARSMLFQRRGGIFHGIAFIGDAEHGNIIQGISKEGIPVPCVDVNTVLHFVSLLRLTLIYQ